MNSSPAPASDSPGRGRRMLPPRYFAAALVAMLVLALVLPGARLIPFPWNLLGLIPLILGAAMNVVADRQFKQAGTTVKPFATSSTLVTDGVFRFTRNPMYLGMVSSLAGVAVLLRELSPWVVVPLFAALMQRVFVRSEERLLEGRFEEEWRSYASRVRQWI